MNNEFGYSVCQKVICVPKDFGLAVVFLCEELNQKPIMKKSLCLLAGLFALGFVPVFGQPAMAPAPMQAPPPARTLPIPARPLHMQTIDPTTGLPIANTESGLTKFDLDFSGGTPAQLVKAIEKAMGKPLNVIIPEEDANTQLPPLKMTDVDVAALFQALEQASRKSIAVSPGSFGISYQTFVGGYSFKTSGPLSDSSIWFFHVEKPSLPPVVSTDKVCQFYSLEPYLNRGFTVDDITTAIQTGWKMSGISPLPELNYHKETKMLIAYGEPRNLETITRVLQNLPSSVATVNEIGALKDQANRLQYQLEQLKKKVSSGTALPTNSSEEKSGK